jgi:hypothetical protein
MSSHGIRDRVAIIGVGCTHFGERFDLGLDDLIREAAGDAFESAGVTKDDVDAYWFGTAQSGMSGITVARPLGGELLRHRLRSAAPGRLRRGQWRLRHRHGDRRGEG